MELAVSTYGKLDAIVNNAAAVFSPILNPLTFRFFRQVLEVNTLAPFSLIKLRCAIAVHTRVCAQYRSLMHGVVSLTCSRTRFKGALMTMTRNLGDTLHREYGVRLTDQSGLGPDRDGTKAKKRSRPC